MSTGLTAGVIIKRTSEGNLQNEAVYVTLPGSVDVKPDNYSDTVTIHVNY